jgi:glucose/arabinose dehydrogenase
VTVRISTLVIIILALAALACGAGGIGQPTGEPPSPVVTTPTPPGEAPTATPPGEDTPVSPPPTNTPAPTDTPSESVSLSNMHLELQTIVGGLARPVAVANAGDGSGRLFVVEKGGTIRVVEQNGTLLDAPFLDIRDRVGSSGSEQGLLGLAFHPDYASNSQFFVDYTDQQGNTQVSRFLVTGDPNRADPASEQPILSLNQPASNHNGGDLVFGPDGYLYIGAGDGGGAGDRYGNGQNLGTLLGAILRLDVDGGSPYAIPADNPFVGDEAARGEIWAYGLRNPWRFSFDRATGDLYIADVGQDTYEEVDVQPAGSTGGENYGWPIMEGLHCYPADAPCSSVGLVPPVTEYEHGGLHCSITGGYVYRGSAFPFFQGVYVFGDYCSGVIWGMRQGSDGWQVVELSRSAIRISTFGESEDGEVYVADLGVGVLYRLIPVAGN